MLLQYGVQLTLHLDGFYMVIKYVYHEGFTQPVDVLNINVVIIASNITITWVLYRDDSCIT